MAKIMATPTKIAMRNQNARAALNKAEKYLAFKTAFRLVNQYMSGGHFIGAYVLLFSIIEDRINAMYAVRFFLSRNIPTPEGHVKGAIADIPFVRKVKKLKGIGDIESKFADELIERANDRNRKIHAALWVSREFEEGDALLLKKQARSIDEIRNKQRKNVKM